MPDETIRVNFSRPMPLFPLNTVVLMPHGVVPLHIFEERYRQMIGDVLDGSGQIAMAVFEGDHWKQEYHGRPPIRPAVCVGQVVQHHKFPDGRYNVAIQGLFRARVVEELPAEHDRLYRQAMLEPLDVEGAHESELSPYRQSLAVMLEQKPLSDLREAATVAEHLRNIEIPSAAILELITLSFLTDPELRYRLLATAVATDRARIIETELTDLADLLRRAAPQRDEECPKGCSWN